TFLSERGVSARAGIHSDHVAHRTPAAVPNLSESQRHRRSAPAYQTRGHRDHSRTGLHLTGDDIQSTCAALDELAMRPPDDDVIDEVMALMERAIGQPGGLTQLAERYGGSSAPQIMRPLTFFVARTISREGAPAGATAATVLLERFNSDDDST